MRFGIFANMKRRGAKTSVCKAVEWIEKNGHDYRLADDLKGLPCSPKNLVPREQVAKLCDYVISMGGDGTLLASARTVGDSQVPILGVNLGSLGFLTQVTADEIDRSLQLVCAGKFEIEPRIRLEAYVVGSENQTHYFALNDMVINRGNVARLIELVLYVNDEFISTYMADGLIISTPTGSTAYNAAVGGPILNPMMEAMIVSPIAPQSLAARPLLFSGSDRIRIKTSSKRPSALLTADGQVSVPLPGDSEIAIVRAKQPTNLISLNQSSFYEILRNKLHWAVLPKAPQTNN